jgi:hypothetical protein
VHRCLWMTNRRPNFQYQAGVFPNSVHLDELNMLLSYRYANTLTVQRTEIWKKKVHFSFSCDWFIRVELLNYSTVAQSTGRRECSWSELSVFAWRRSIGSPNAEHSWASDGTCSLMVEMGFPIIVGFDLSCWNELICKCEVTWMGVKLWWPTEYTCKYIYI